MTRLFRLSLLGTFPACWQWWDSGYLREHPAVTVLKDHVGILECVETSTWYLSPKPKRDMHEPFLAQKLLE